MKTLLHTLEINGDHDAKGFHVLLSGRCIRCPHRLYEYLLELCIASTSECGFLYNIDSFVIEGDDLRATDIVRHLRRVLGSKALIVAGRKSYKLSDKLRPPRVSKAVLDIRSIDPRILARLIPIVNKS